LYILYIARNVSAPLLDTHKLQEHDC